MLAATLLLTHTDEGQSSIAVENGADKQNKPTGLWCPFFPAFSRMVTTPLTFFLLGRISSF